MDEHNLEKSYVYICMECKKENRVKISQQIVCSNCQFRIFMKPRSKTPVQLLAR